MVATVAIDLSLPRPLELAGQASKRGLIPRMPTGERLLGDVAAWLGSEYPDQLRWSRSRPVEDGAAELAVSLHPAAADVVLRATDAGVVTIHAETAAAGPGYHRFVGRVLERLGANQGIEWTIGAGDGFLFADRAAVERGYLGWLGPALTQARAARQRDGATLQLGLPTGTTYSTAGAVLTPLGPRDDAWLDAAIADPRRAIDITPWWLDATDPRYLLDRALVLLWTEVRWRAPALSSEEAVMDEVHRCLSRAFPVDPSLEYPWAAWAEVVACRGIDDAMARQAVARGGAAAAAAGRDAPRIGYRRDPVRITHEGWALEVPGGFAERRTTEEWWGGGAGRRITLAAVPTGSMSAEAFVRQFASDLGDDALSHRDGELVGRARITTDPSSGLEVGVLDGYAAVAGSGAAIRVEFDDPADWQWAVERWRALAPG